MDHEGAKETKDTKREGAKRACERLLPGEKEPAESCTFERLSYNVFAACIDVQRQIGTHCMEVDYQRAVALALAKRGLEFIREAEIPIMFDGVEVTKRRVDFVIWDHEATVILELRAAAAVKREDYEQCLMYLKNGNFRVCLLANFGEVPLGKWRRIWSPTGPALYGPHL